MIQRLKYWKRIGAAYLLGGNSHLTFWHEAPAAHAQATFDRLGPYYMTFAGKAAYPGPFDGQGIPMLDYRGDIGLQYNPIAVAQYGLAHYNLYRADQSARSREIFIRQADWLFARLKTNREGCAVWNHDFAFEYRDLLRPPWYSALAQGQGISLLARAFEATRDQRYRDAMERAYETFEREMEQGGVRYTDRNGDAWLEEYIVYPPTHILNGFIWALWGVWDYHLCARDGRSRELFSRCAATLEKNIPRYDTGYWSLYDLSGTRIPMIASSFYHRLHIVQLEILQRLTGKAIFGRYARQWREYEGKRINRARSLIQKCAFKLLYF